ncbi:hypothetical protein [Paraburkholderia sediminicola]|uniref:hypothetical protein n=1 Tax=Paraburkholderia sediminicola TaxID=458836 RepID=UPI0038BC3AB4
MEMKLTKEQVGEPRRSEEGCAARIASIKRKLAGGPAAVTPELLMQWEKEPHETRGKLIAAGEIPAGPAI